MHESMHARLTLRKFGIACLIAMQAALPCLVLAQANLPNPAGFVSSIIGKLFMLDSNGIQVPVRPGDVFGPTTTFVSGPDSSAVILFADGQSVTLNQDSTLRVADYKFDTADLKASRATLQLMRGAMSYVSGAILTDNSAGLRISGGNAAVSILSKDVTAFVMEVDPKSVGIGTVAVTIGEVRVETPVGSIGRLGAEQFSRWQDGSGPTNAAPISAAPAVFQALVTASRAKVTGSNSPIDVRSASVAAALTDLQATGAGNTDQAQQDQQAQAPDTTVVAFTQAVTPGGGRGCVGSPC